MHAAVVADLAEDPRVGALVTTLAETARASSDPRQALLRAPALAALRERLEPTLRSHGYLGFAVIDPFGLRLAAGEDGVVGRRLRTRYDVVQAALEGEVGISNTIVVFDYGHTPEGTFYYAMEYLDGITVGQCVEEDGAQDEARVVHVMKQVCGSIVEAHAAGLIHRDLKPANLMLCQRGGCSTSSRCSTSASCATRRASWP
jgi:serine/threonine protein kinase